MANTYKALSTVTVGAGGAASISFTNIPQTYTDLKIIYSLRNTRVNPTDSVSITLNSISSGSAISMRGNGSSTTAYTNTTLIAGRCTSANATANVFGNGEIYISNYASNSLRKLFLVDTVTENNATEAFQEIIGNTLLDTTPITSLTIFGDNGNLVQYSTATLYGVFNADVSSAPATPTIGTATAGIASASITFTGVSNAASYTMTSTPGNYTATGTTSPITVDSLIGGTSYTFKVKANNPFGSSAESAASNSVTPTRADFLSLATATVASGTQNEITFSSIPSDYTHLQLRIFGRTNRTSNTQANVVMRFNNDTGSNYAFHDLYGDGSSTTASASTNQTNITVNRISGADAGSNTFGAIIIDILDYANTNKYKTIRALGGIDNNGNGAISFSSGVWMNTNAITEIDLTTIAGSFNFTQYSHFALYGIRSA